MKANAVTIDKMAVPALLLLLSIIIQVLTISAFGSMNLLDHVQFYIMSCVAFFTPPISRTDRAC